MALVICCPCGNPIDFEHLDLLVALTCPRCERELDLEFETGPTDRRRGFLTVMAGPHWVGEQFLVPVGVELRIGNGGGNWISLESGKVGAYHCRLQLTQQGVLFIEDAKSASGTWIGDQRIARGKLAAKQSFRVGEFRFRLDFQNIDGTTIMNAPAATYDRSGVLPTMAKVRPKASVGGWLVSSRFRVVRGLLMICAGCMGVYHTAALMQANEPWHWARASASAGAIALLTFLAGRQVTLAHQHFRYAPIGLMAALGILDAIWRLPSGIITHLGMAAATSMMILSSPPPAVVVAGACVGTVSAIIGLGAAIVGLIGLAG